MITIISQIFQNRGIDLGNEPRALLFLFFI